MNKCQCPEEGRATDKFMYGPEEWAGMWHEPGECKGTNDIKLYNRNGTLLYLCSCCHSFMFGDVEVPDVKVE